MRALAFERSFTAVLSAFVFAAPLLIASAQAEALPEARAADQFAFADVDDRMTVPVRILGAGGGDPVETGPYRFIVDTGAERTVISRELAGTLGLAAGRTVRITAMAGSGDFGTYIIPRIRVGAVDAARPLSGQRVSGQRIEAPGLVQRHIGAAGLVGIDTLQGHALTIDFDRRSMTVVPSTRRLRRERFGPGDIVIHARNLLGQLVVTDASYRGTRIRVIVDTGSVVSMGNLALRNLVARDTKTMQPIHVTSVTGAELDADYTQVSDMRLADIGFANLPVAFSNALPFKRLGLVERPALLLGMDAMRMFGRVRIDFANRELRLERPRGATVRGSLPIGGTSIKMPF